MPWWGWLIAGSVGFIGLVLLAGLGMVLHAMKTIDEDQDDGLEEQATRVALVICPACRRAAASLGSISADELIFPVVDLYLANGAITTTARLRGPVRRGDTSDYVVLDRAGRAVYRSRGVNRLRWPAIPAGGEIAITTALHIREIV